MNLLQNPAYNPNHLLDTLIKKMEVKSDAALAKRLEVAPPVISKLRHKRIPIGASILISMHEESGFEIRELKQLMGALPADEMYALAA